MRALIPLPSPGTMEPRAGSTPCPARMYLARLRRSGRTTMTASLLRVGRMLCGETATLSEVPWHELRYEHLLAVRTKLAEAGAAPSYVNKHLTAVRGVLRQCWKLGTLGLSEYHRARSVENVKAFRLPAGRMLTDDELRVLVSAALPRDLAILALCFGAGLRRSEACMVDVDNLHPSTGAVTVVAGKGGKDRHAFIGRTGWAWLQAWEEAVWPRSCPAVLLTKNGRRLSPGALYDALRALCARSGVKACSPHDLRRTFASRALDGGADLSTVSSLMGHADPRTTARYDRRGDESKRSASEAAGL